MEAVSREELAAVVASVARGCKGCPRRGKACEVCDRFQCRTLAERMGEGGAIGALSRGSAIRGEEVNAEHRTPNIELRTGEGEGENSKLGIQNSELKKRGYTKRVFAAGLVRRLGKGAYPEGMPCKDCAMCSETGGCGANPIKERCEAYRRWIKKMRVERERSAIGALSRGSVADVGTAVGV